MNSEFLNPLRDQWNKLAPRERRLASDRDAAELAGDGTRFQDDDQALERLDAIGDELEHSQLIRGSDVSEWCTVIQCEPSHLVVVLDDYRVANAQGMREFDLP